MSCSHAFNFLFPVHRYHFSMQMNTKLKCSVIDALMTDYYLANVHKERFGPNTAH